MRLPIFAFIAALPTVSYSHHQCDRAVGLLERALVETGDFNIDEFEAAAETQTTLFLLASAIYVADGILVRDRIMQQTDVADPLALRFVAGGELIECSNGAIETTEQFNQLDQLMPAPLRQLMREYVLENYREPT